MLSKEPFSIGLVGTYDVSNFGDCIFPDIYVQQLSKRIPNLQFKLYSPQACAAPILNFRSVNALPASLMDASFPDDCLILTGGETLSLGHSSGTYILPLNTMSHYLRMWLGPAVAATRSHTKFIIHCAGIPLGKDEALPLIGRILEGVDSVTLRDTVSRERLGGQFTTCVDPAFLMHQLETPEEWLARARQIVPSEAFETGYLAVQISQSYLHGNLAEWCNAVAEILRETERSAILLPICHFLGDHELLAKIHAIFRERFIDIAPKIHLAPSYSGVRDTAAIIARSEGYIGTSLHGAVAAAAFAKPRAILSASMDGKHAQTLLTAGVTPGVCDQIENLPHCFRKTTASNLTAERDEAAYRAAADFDRMCEMILSPRHDVKTPDESDVAQILKADRAYALAPSIRIKRLIFSAMKHLPVLQRWYDGSKLWRRFAARVRTH